MLLNLCGHGYRWPWLVAIALLLVGCTVQSAQTTAAFPVLDESFTQHRDELRTWLVQHRMSGRSEADVELNLPFEKLADPGVPYRGRFLLFHGLNDSPYVWHDFASELVQRGFDVRAVLFEGHGSSPVDMLEVQAESWVKTARRYRNAWADPDVPLYLGGFSMGAVIATMLALDHPDTAGLLLVSPAYHSRLNRMLRFSGIYKSFKPWLFGGMIGEDNPIKYNSIPINSGWQFFRLTRMLKRRWRTRDRIAMPTLMVVSDADSVVDHAYTRRLFRRRFTHPDRLLVTYSSDSASPAIGAAAVDVAASPRPTEMFREARFPQLRILSQSHLGLMYAPENPLFGRHGSVLVCNGNEWAIYSACLKAQEHWFGAQHAPSPDGTPVARTTWNPDWDWLLQRFDERVVAPGT